MSPSGKIELTDLTKDGLVSWLKEHDIAPYRASQILRWIYLRQVDSFDNMTDLTKSLRHHLASHFTIRRLTRLHLETSRDGTRKYLFQLEDGNLIETVLIPERDHFTLCISSQVGCAQGCRFCLTARRGFVRNLTAGEIIAQVRDALEDVGHSSRLTNIVFMGMGEPLANYQNVVNAIHLITDNDVGLKFTNRKVTLSTAGLVPELFDLGTDTRVNLAVSLNATDDETRSRLMPINRKYSLDKLLNACRAYPLAPGRRITFEYILMKDVNDTEKDAERLSRLLKPIKAKVNLIPFNAFDGSGFTRPSEEQLCRFQDVLLQNHFTVVIRRSKGQDIGAACGQLSGSWKA